MTELDRWMSMGVDYDYTMPPAARWKRFPIIRHVRTLVAMRAVDRHYRYGMGSFGLRTGYDSWVLFGMWHGMEREP